MRRLIVFDNVSLDGYFVDRKGDMGWAHKDDPEWRAFTSKNAKGGGQLVFGRKTYDMMASFWPTPYAMESMPAVAKGMNGMPKTVFSRSLKKAGWSNTTVVKGDIVAKMRKMKAEPGPDMVILGSGSIVSKFAQAGLIDEFQLVVHPLVLGKGRTLFEGVRKDLHLMPIGTKSFKNGVVLLRYRPA